jgi:uncharacterized protein YaiL (DUF2058 family)
MNIDQSGNEAASISHPQCKVCESPDRFEIEVALAQGQPQQHIARRFSHGEQSFSKQNIHSHYHRHMPVIEKAVAEAAAVQNRGLLLDLETATAIEVENARNRARLRAQVSRLIEQGQLNWRPRDVMAFMEFDARLGQVQSDRLEQNIGVQLGVLGEAVERVIGDETLTKVLDEYDHLIAERELPEDERALSEEFRTLFERDQEDA